MTERWIIAGVIAATSLYALRGLWSEWRGRSETDPYRVLQLPDMVETAVPRTSSTRLPSTGRRGACLETPLCALGCRLLLVAAHRLGGRGPQRESRCHARGEQAEDSAPVASPPVSSSGTTSGKPVRPRGTPATATATIARSGAECGDDGRQHLERRPSASRGWRSAQQADGRELVAAFGCGHRRGVDRASAANSGRERPSARRPTRPSTLAAWTRVEVLAAAQRPHAGVSAA